ncbi:DUF1254 domain-containing protein [Nocardia cyriacigeorgica]|uniref:DUF1254 domain-containing protein n=1 Tax=Nocardia cyriacigeorgica TaxID=135487 RepID=UPI002458E6E1|nr:DUF1254 domain-containing protein [Nocardia cyriacigeorgica]
MTTEEPSELAARAYIYGFPLVFNLDQVGRYVRDGVGANPAAPWNTFSHARTLAGPADTFVTINNDTVYSMAQIDLSIGPVSLHVPDTAGRYYVLQFVDAWTDNFAYVGHRATGTGAGDYLLVPPGWTGQAPHQHTVITFPTTIASIVGRWACADDADLPAVHALQDAMTLTPLDLEARPAGLPEPDPAVDADLLFWEKMRLWSQAFPPAPRDRELQRSLGPPGISEVGRSPYIDADTETADALRAGSKTGSVAIDAELTHGSTPEVNGWKLALHAFDYNLDYFEVGALDDPRFKTSPQRRIIERAASAKGGLWGNHAYEAAYIVTYVDNQGEQLTGGRTYTLRLDPTPPVGAFWSITMYSVPDFYLVDNPIARYSIGDRTPGIVYDDGALTITISHTPPSDPTALANWLPAPAGDFRPVLRMYEPSVEVLDQTYVVAAITRHR